MKNKIKSKIVSVIWPSLKKELRENKERLSVFLKSLCFWKHEIFVFSVGETNPAKIRFRGRLESVPALKALLGIRNSNVDAKVRRSNDLDEIFVYELPVPGALCVPQCLSTMVKLDKPIEDILADYSRSLRRSITKQAPKFRYEVVTEDAEIEGINKTMLMPYAEARHDLGAYHLDVSDIKSLAQGNFGRLDVLFEGEEQVGCHLGNAYTRRGESYWHVNRFGYTENVFSDNRCLNEVNSINLHLALVSAIGNGFDYCDYGMSLATPGRGPIEWKRRRKGFLAREVGLCYYLKPPKTGAAEFFWGSPLFALESGEITLHIGLPANKTVEEVAERYIELGYGGLSKVYLHCLISPTEEVVQLIHGLYAKQQSQPKVVIHLVG